MPAEIKKEIELEIAYVLFIDIIGYSKLLVDPAAPVARNTQRRLSARTEQFQRAEVKRWPEYGPTGDGMALVFYNTPGSAGGMRARNQSGYERTSGTQTTDGSHSGRGQRRSGRKWPRKHCRDRKQYCAAGNGWWRHRPHPTFETRGGRPETIRRLEAPSARPWRTEVKQGAHVSVVNLYTEELGNPEVPQKFRQARQKAAMPAFDEKRSRGRSWIIAAAAIILARLP